MIALGSTRTNSMSDTDSRFFRVEGPFTMYGDSGISVDAFTVLFTSCTVEGQIVGNGSLTVLSHDDALLAGRRWVNTGATTRST